MSNQFGWLWDGVGREEAVGKRRVSSVPRALDRRQCYSSSFRAGWSARSAASILISPPKVASLGERGIRPRRWRWAGKRCSETSVWAEKCESCWWVEGPHLGLLITQVWGLEGPPGRLKTLGSPLWRAFSPVLRPPPHSTNLDSLHSYCTKVLHAITPHTQDSNNNNNNMLIHLIFRGTWALCGHVSYLS